MKTIEVIDGPYSGYVTEHVKGRPKKLLVKFDKKVGPRMHVVEWKNAETGWAFYLEE